MEGQKKEKLSEVGEFISEYSAHMMGCGVHTSRVIRSVLKCCVLVVFLYL